MGIPKSQLDKMQRERKLCKLQARIPLLEKEVDLDTDVVLLQDCWILHGLWLGKTS